MNPAQFRARLASLHLSQVGFAERISEVGGETLSPRTVEQWAQGRREIPPTVPALLALLERVQAHPPPIKAAPTNTW